MAHTAARDGDGDGDAQRDVLAALLRRPSSSRTSSSSNTDSVPPGTPRPMPFDPQTQPPPIEPFQLTQHPLPSSSSSPPRKRILTQPHLVAFLASHAHQDLLSFLRQGAAAITAVPVPADITTPEPASAPATQEEGDKRTGIQAALALLSEVSSILHAHPPPHTPSQGTGSASAQGRFGNPTFRNFHSEIAARSHELHSTFFPALRESEGDDQGVRRGKAVLRTELGAYFGEAWGNASRIDYGSGMELNFVCWLLILYKLGIFNDSVPSSSSTTLAPLSELGPDLFLRVFWSYILLMRRIQATYFLEPAGSHGVWGLDDYHFLPFLLGAAQLSNHPYLRPSSIHSTDILAPPSKYPSEYIYLSQIALLHSIKVIPGSSSSEANSLRWHSPMLDDISSVKSWAQVERGMWKMLEAEVVGKLPVAQHFLFGSVLEFPPGFDHDHEGEQEGKESACGHHHPLPSASPVVVLDANGTPLPRPTGHAHAHSHAEKGTASNTVDAPQQGGTTGWGDCCGIPIPSAYGAAAAQAEEGGQNVKAPVVQGRNGGVVAETGQLGRAKGWSASPAALERHGGGDASSAAPQKQRKNAVPAAGGVRRIPFD
ncbi:hypothetical protein A4X03_0g4662 [Tilletia caries]|uniref:Serine/threonine-protein phosphatase 2A activator n=1 Tax=Tilletia caries TaxID=13290 RepID=A0A177VBS9_9BASI|nr:hypothetical protein A4X03_0g4662 [Tilletia caries]CAD6961394.1 unnamed protein product [Tilletia caries]